MPIVYSKIDLTDVKLALKAKGYDFHGNREFPLQLNVASKTRFRKIDGAPYRDMLRGIDEANLNAILLKATSIEDAVMMIENLSLGNDLSPIETTRGEANALSAEQIAHLIDNRVGMQVQREMEPIRTQMQSLLELAQKLVDVREAAAKKPEEATEEKKVKRGRKPKRSPEEVDKVLQEMGLAEVRRPNFDA